MGFASFLEDQTLVGELQERRRPSVACRLCPPQRVLSCPSCNLRMKLLRPAGRKQTRARAAATAFTARELGFSGEFQHVDASLAA